MSTTTRARVFLTPWDAVAVKQTLVDLIKRAKQTIDLPIYALTDAGYVAALTTAAARKVAVRVILDRTQTLDPRQASARQLLAAGGVSVLVGTSPQAHALMHQKSLIVDAMTVATGSLNWSYAAPAEVNDLLILSSRKLAAMYTQRFEELWEWITTNEASYQTPQASPPAGIL